MGNKIIEGRRGGVGRRRRKEEGVEDIVVPVSHIYWRDHLKHSNNCEQHLRCISYDTQNK
jgi:hypothetical protein